MFSFSSIIFVIVLKLIISMVCHDEMPSLIGDINNGQGHWGGGRGGMREESSPGRRGIDGPAQPNFKEIKKKKTVYICLHIHHLALFNPLLQNQVSMWYKFFV